MHGHTPKLAIYSNIKRHIATYSDICQGSRINNHGPFFGTNEHPRRDTDVILRLPKSTIEDLSFQEGVIMESMAKMMVYYENDM